MNKKNKVKTITALLRREYPNPRCMLNYSAPHELVIAVRLSAQCTDLRVNAVTPALFAKYPTAADFAAANIDEIEEIIKPCGLYRTKAADIAGIGAALSRRPADSPVPDSMEELLELPGVGRKTANLVLGELFGKPAVVADTHVIRLSNRLGLARSRDALKVEQSLRAALPPKESLEFCHRLVLHGRAVCKARKPDCGLCVLRAVCGAEKS